MPDQLVFAMEVILNGLMAGVLYALVALGFVETARLIRFGAEQVSYRLDRQSEMRTG